MNAPPTPWFRRILVVLHLLVASLFCLLVAMSVVKSVAAMTPKRTWVAGAQSVDDCQKQGWLLLESLEKERQNWVFPELKTANNWMEYRAEWMTQLERLQKSCEDAESQKLFEMLRKLMAIYSIHMMAFVQELAPAIKPLQR
ncbi:MAG: hypothetical protein FWG75_00105 [Cystobacterineae bacterium]|nr:hypothetical protein [Cystobacterineae bacterium]